MSTDVASMSRVLNIPKTLISAELEGLYGSNVLQDMQDIISLYETYEKGADFSTEGSADYVPAKLRSKKVKGLINKEVRFMFSKTPDFFVDTPVTDNKTENERNKKASTAYKTLIDKVLGDNGFSLKLLKAAKDCFVGKRVALMFNINEGSGIQISFLPSLEFVYDVDPNDANKLTKIVAFFNLNTAKAKSEQRIYKKKFWLQDGFAHYTEAIYDGTGKPVETVAENVKTNFPWIPAWVILNDGLTGDLMGDSEVTDLEDHEEWYSKMSSADLDAERKGMNPIRYTVDMAPESTKGLSIAAGAFWDLSTDQNQAVDRPAQVGVLDSPMTYSTALSTTLDRIKNDMHEQVAVPNVSPEALKGVVSSGKTLRAIYWDLIVRADEKMLAWRPALQFLGKCIIEGIRFYPKVAEMYLDEPLPDTPYEIRVDNQYSLPEDEAEEKQVDLAEVTAQTRSRKSYMKKWHNLTDDEADEEIRQIALERELLEDSYSAPSPGGENPPDEEDDPTEPPKQDKGKKTEEEETEEDE